MQKSQSLRFSNKTVPSWFNRVNVSFEVNTVLTEDFVDVPFYLVCTFHLRLVWAHTICQKLSLLGKEYVYVVDTSKLH